MEDEIQLLQKAKNIFKNLKTDPNSMLFSEEKNRQQIHKNVTKIKVCKRFLVVNSFDGPFQLIHADLGNLEFLGKSATTPRYVLLAVDLYYSKVDIYPMRSRKQILQKMKEFYEDIESKRNMKKKKKQCAFK